MADSSNEKGSDGISFSLISEIEPASQEDPLDKAIRLVKQEMSIVESRNQVETNLRAFDVSSTR